MDGSWYAGGGGGGDGGVWDGVGSRSCGSRMCFRSGGRVRMGKTAWWIWGWLGGRLGRG